MLRKNKFPTKVARVSRRKRNVTVLDSVLFPLDPRKSLMNCTTAKTMKISSSRKKTVTGI